MVDYSNINEKNMKIELNKIGTILTSRPSGKDAWLTMKAYVLPNFKEESIEIDFTGIQVITPGWLDEFLTPLKTMFPNKVKYLPYNNASVKASLEILESQHQ
jgi:hypothetical protein